MTTVPPKSHQPLHNFSLPLIKWGQRSHVNTYKRYRRFLSHTTTTINPHRRTSPSTDSESNNGKDKGTTIDEGESENNSSKVDAAEAKPWNLRSAISNHRVNGTSNKRKLWISLSKEEIEEDVYALTGLKPGRRAKKRNRTIQKQVDNLFPGLHLVGISPDSYRL